MVFILRISPNQKCTFCDDLISRNLCFAFRIFRDTKIFPVCLNCSPRIN